MIVRDRSSMPSQDRKLERVVSEEIARALMASVKRNFSMSVDDAITEAANDLGFQRVTASMHKRISEVLRALVSRTWLRTMVAYLVCAKNRLIQLNDLSLSGQRFFDQ